MNNFEKIKDMSINEMAEEFESFLYDACACNKYNCLIDIKQWLQAESGE